MFLTLISHSRIILLHTDTSFGGKKKKKRYVRTYCKEKQTWNINIQAKTGKTLPACPFVAAATCASEVSPQVSKITRIQPFEAGKKKTSAASQIGERCFQNILKTFSEHSQNILRTFSVVRTSRPSTTNEASSRPFTAYMLELKFVSCDSSCTKTQHCKSATKKHARQPRKNTTKKRTVTLTTVAWDHFPSRVRVSIRVPGLSLWWFQRGAQRCARIRPQAT
jgi:hypothetical protein